MLEKIFGSFGDGVREERETQQMFYYRAGDEAGGLGLKGAEGEVRTSR